ncbi:hypothetical protein BDI4_1610003 [Burkholderia diffusa]|nr:hypothetical protein BDI4_1610003 [Burkholderia diffusa]
MTIDLSWKSAMASPITFGLLDLRPGDEAILIGFVRNYDDHYRHSGSVSHFIFSRKRRFN